MNEDGSVEFTFFGTVGNGDYIAFGLSDTSTMGDTNVMFCFVKDDVVTVGMGWNPNSVSSLPLEGEALTAGLNPLDEPAESFGSYEDGVLTCSFVRDAITEIPVPGGDTITFDLQNTDYFIMAAYGPMSSPETFQIAQHNDKAVRLTLLLQIFDYWIFIIFVNFCRPQEKRQTWPTTLVQRHLNCGRSNCMVLSWLSLGTCWPRAAFLLLVMPNSSSSGSSSSAKTSGSPFINHS